MAFLDFASTLPKRAAGAAFALLLSAPAIGQGIVGAGASFPAPLYAKWAEAYNKATGTRGN
jgi:phosphate transport system substrate-binding protein